MFAHIRVLGPLMEAIRARGVPATGLDLGANVRGTIDQRVSRLREAVAAHAETGGRVVLVAHSMGAFVCARYLVERPPGVSGFISLCGVFGGIRPWTLLGWPIFDVVREMRRETGGRLTPELRRVIEEPSVPTTLFQADKDEFVRDQSAFRNVRSFRTAVTHNGPVIESGAVAAIADQVAEFLARPS
jgi:pimeloyl-ACP methyl ester carboxylesterase